MHATTQALQPQAFEKLRSLIEEVEIGMITTVTPEGALRSRPMVTLELSDDGRLWFFTADDSGKAHDIADEHSVNVCYSDGASQRYVSVTGNATLTHDEEKARELWDPSFETYMPGGLENPHLALLQVRIETAEFWDFSGGANGSAEKNSSRHHRSDRSQQQTKVDHTKVDIRATPASG